MINESKTLPSGRLCFIHILCLIFLFLTSPRFTSLLFFQSFVSSLFVFFSPFLIRLSRSLGPRIRPRIRGYTDGVVTVVCPSVCSPAVRVHADWSDRTRTHSIWLIWVETQPCWTHGSLYKHTFLMSVPLFTPVYQKLLQLQVNTF